MIGMHRDMADQGLQITFYADCVEDTEATEQAGRPIYKEVDLIRVHVPSDSSCDVETTINKSHIARFGYEYEQYKKTKVDPISGTPLKMWPAISVASVKELAHFQLVTVEQLAELTPMELRQHDWMKPLHEKAVAWLASVNDNGAVLELEAQLQAVTQQLQHAEAENVDLRSQAFEAAKEAVKAPKGKPVTK